MAEATAAATGVGGTGRPSVRLVLCALCVTACAAFAAAQDSVELVASKGGFRPKAVNARKGEPLRLVLKTADDEHCFALDALRIEKRIRPGKPVTLDLTPDRVGSFPFYCCLEPDNEAMRGRLVVTE